MPLCYFVGKKVVLGLKEGNKCVGSGLAWMRSGIKGINYASLGLAWVSCEHVGRPWASTVPGTLQAGPGKST